MSTVSQANQLAAQQAAQQKALQEQLAAQQAAMHSQGMYAKPQSVGQVVDNAANKVANSAEETYQQAKNSGGVWNMLLILVVMIVVFMIVFAVLRLPIVLVSENGILTNTISWSKNFGVSLVLSLLVVLAIWGWSKLTGKNTAMKHN